MKTYHEPARDIPIGGEYDVVVAGGGPTGVGAAAMLSLHEEVAPRALDARLLGEQLRRQGAVLDEAGIRELNA